MRRILVVLVISLIGLGGGLAQADVWQIQTVDNAEEVGKVWTSLALDSSGNPRISYGSGDLEYAAWNGSSWDLETVDSTGNVGWGTSLALDSSGSPRISCYDYTNGALKYAAWDPTLNGGLGDWAIETVESAGSVGPYTSLALDSSGNPHISYSDYTNYDLKYAAWNGSTWDLQTIDSAGWVGKYTSLALDSSGSPRISYYDYGNLDLKYGAWDGLSWDIQTVDSLGTVGWDISLALDEYGFAHISYYDETNGDLKYATNVPEPGTLLLFGLGLPALIAWRRRQHQSQQ